MGVILLGLLLGLISTHKDDFDAVARCLELLEFAAKLRGELATGPAPARAKVKADNLTLEIQVCGRSIQVPEGQAIWKSESGHRDYRLKSETTSI